MWHVRCILCCLQSYALTPHVLPFQVFDMLGAQALRGLRRLARCISTAVERNNRFGRVTEDDVQHFSRIVGSGGVVTDPEQLEAFSTCVRKHRRS
jgi:hypothetical protein